jgi:hypothetical protein
MRGWTCHPSMVPTKQCESGTRNGVRKAFGRTPCTLVTRGCAAGLIKVDELAIDSSSTIPAKKGRDRR